ncbi:spore maturation protein CgeB [Arthrobacter pigmenti]|uniref:Spore maturation protein CgeB n=1 Tax=Arthrobacter pigmenti TaxID=271432 RepID=A0A846RPY2_9MICC|nr:glycosyltransferase [Arthrobacter pigmenti]NJC22642.1 spore maturation protein CgeB [Arthrobacter pigmenti]
MASVNQLRQAVWHFRSGGLEQLREFKLRARHNTWSGRQISVVEQVLGVAFPVLRKPTFVEFELPRPVAASPHIRVGVILDDFSRAGFDWEWTCVPLSPGVEEGDLLALELDFIFIESAWDGNGGSWKYKLLGSGGPSEEVRSLIRLANSLEVPVALWNKEDPPHYEDFLPLARLCDFVFTTDSNMIPRYTADLGHDRVDALPFAAQPKLHNPVRERRGWHDRDVAFAGMYFSHKYPERRKQMEMMLPGAVAACQAERTTFDIFARASRGKKEYQFPDDLQKHVLGELNYAQMLGAYKRYKVFLNVNSVVDSPTMCSRRVFEMTAAGASVVTAPSPAIEALFEPKELSVVSTTEDTTHQIRALLRNPSYAARQVHRAQRRIWREHTYGKRAQQIMAALGVTNSSSAKSPTISVVVPSIRPQQLTHVLEGIAAQKEVSVQLVYGAHGFNLDKAHFHSRCDALGLENATAVLLPENMSLGECLNTLVSHATGDFVAKWDDDDVYAPWYLHDQVMALYYSGASVVGKRAHYVRLNGLGATVIRNSAFEHRFTHFVAGPTLLGRREVFEVNPFLAVTTGEDTAFLRSVLSSGGTVYASDRFNYCQIRQADSNDHTWKISANELLATSEVAFYGDSVEQIFV